jgi:hypothetical protein
VVVELVVLAGTLALAGVGVWRFLRRRRTTATPSPAAGEEKPPDPEPASPIVAFSCPGCGKSIKAKAALAGKKARCPQCAQAVVVPERIPDESDRTSE